MNAVTAGVASHVVEDLARPSTTTHPSAEFTVLGGVPDLARHVLKAERAPRKTVFSNVRVVVNRHDLGLGTKNRNTPGDKPGVLRAGWF